MTEDEAKTRWCPFSNSPTSEEENATTGNRTLMGKPDMTGCFCLGSQCMAWRSTGKNHSDEPFASAIRETGFCGLAGDPRQ